MPKKRQSNNALKTGKITKAGSKVGRTALIQCAWIVVKYNLHLKNFFERIKSKGGMKKAIVACARKLLVIIYNTLRNGWIFEDFSTFKLQSKSTV